MLSNLRRNYWIPNANVAARSIISNCSICRRQRGKLLEQKMADLPFERITPDLPPFSNVGVDYFGPVEGQCGSGWAFSAVGTVEGRLAKKKGILMDLSAQNLVDCSRKYGNKGCKGGSAHEALWYFMLNHGIDSEKGYPYEAKDAACRYNPEYKAYNCNSIISVKNNESSLQKFLVIFGPTAVSVHSSLPGFYYYKSGVFSDPACTGPVDHGVLLVGYSNDGVSDYWIVKNSWGTRWGEDGYMRIVRNKNMCGIATFGVTPAC
ncbi:hypothetical protein WMY93_026182 [Mugilogobius chulae]|uniref:Peptidase C1A papain C-terminal domain-containing protein n=1 Tax=Mugilogobius chulae TaxID=88201 RepID=A0AAW0MWW1_9GOBI